MNWLNGCALTWQLDGCVFEPGETWIKFSFCQNSFWQECKEPKTLVVRGVRGLEKQPIIYNNI